LARSSKWIWICVCSAAVGLAGCARFENKPLSAGDSAQALESRSLSDPGLKQFLETNLHQGFASWPKTNFDFAALTLTALYYHPSLDVARAQWAVAQGGAKTAGGRPNPVLTVAPGYSANPPRNVSPWFPSVTLDVPIETAGKRAYRMARAEHLAEAARLNILAGAWQVRSGVRAALVDYTAARRRFELLQQSTVLQQRLVTLLDQRLAAGAVSTAEVAPARITLVRLQGELAQARRLAAEARGKMATALAVPLRALDGVEFDFDLSQPPSAGLLAEEARRQALQSRPDLLAALAEYAAGQSALQLEIARQYPDVHLAPGYQYDQGENKWQLGLSVELPVLNRNQGPIAEAKARRDELAARFTAVQARVISEVDRALLQHTAALEQARQLETLRGAQREQAERVERAVAAGAADQVEMSVARLELDALELSRLDALVQQQIASGLLEDALQQPSEVMNTVEHDPKTQVAKEKDKP
jgi:outer membrane protein TolC